MIIQYSSIKPQGEASDTTLHLKDFVLAIQTPLQAEMLKKFGPNHIICIDATHGTNAYDFSLLTVLVIDEYGKGYPISWCISNRMDLTLLIQVFKAMKAKVGNIVPKWVMSDDADQLYSAWFSVFGPGPQKLLCTWHVDRAWRGRLNGIKDRELAQKIYHNFRVLMEEEEEQRFESLLNETQKQMSTSPQTKDFLNYFLIRTMPTENISGHFATANSLTSTQTCMWRPFTGY